MIMTQNRGGWLCFLLCIVFMAGCAHKLPLLPSAAAKHPVTTDPTRYRYLIGPGDSLEVFVWRNPELSTTLSVRPDGKISLPLVEDIGASGKTPTQLARDLEKNLRAYIKEPIVSITVKEFIGPYSEQVRVVGEALKPQALAYRENMTLLDLMIAVGGLTEFADGDSAVLTRVVDGEQKQYRALLDRLIRDGDIRANGEILPGDVLIIPESWF